MTLSLLGADPERGEVGMVLTSSSPAVAARCASVRAGVGVAASQNVTDPRLGPEMLDALRAGGTPQDALGAVRAGAAHAEHRQLAVLDRDGSGAVWTGARALGVHHERMGTGCVAAGNLLAAPAVVDALIEGFEATAGQPLAERLLAGLRAAVAAGGEAGPLRAAGMLIAAADVSWPVVDLRVDWSDDPVGDLQRVWAVYGPQKDEYVTRALNPDAAPAYGVPGDEG